MRGARFFCPRAPPVRASARICRGQASAGAVGPYSDERMRRTMGCMLGAALDVFRLRQYFNIITRTREFVEGVREDAGLINDARRALVTLPFHQPREPDLHPFPSRQPL